VGVSLEGKGSDNQADFPRTAKLVKAGGPGIKIKNCGQILEFLPAEQLTVSDTSYHIVDIMVAVPFSTYL
jgi:hypothetical protein